MAERWGFGEQIIARHPFREWAMDALEMPKAEVEECETGLRLSKGGLKPTYAIAAVQVERNQIVLIKSSSRDESRRPQWDWLI